MVVNEFNAYSVLASDILAGATTFSVTSGDGSKFPNPLAGQYFFVRLGGEINNEVVKVTSRTNDVCTCEATTSDWSSGELVICSIATEVFDEYLQLNEAEQIVKKFQIQNYYETVATPSSSSGTLIVDLENGNIINTTLTEDITTINIINIPMGGVSVVYILNQDITGGRNITWPDSFKWAGGVTPSLTLWGSGINIVASFTVDGGNTWYCKLVGNTELYWDITLLSATASYTFVDAEHFSDINGIWFSTDGTKLFLAQYNPNDVYEYNLSTPWEISTAVYSTFYHLSVVYPNGMYFNPDGDKMFIFTSVGVGKVYSFSLSTPWDISTVSYVTNVDIPDYGYFTHGTGFWKSDGSEVSFMYTESDGVPYDLNTYTLGVNWDITTINATSVRTYRFTDNEGSRDPFCINDKHFILYDTSPTASIYQYDMSVSGDVTTFSASKSFTPNESLASSVFYFNGRILYICSGNNVRQYDLA